ncbi:MAG: HTH domain-containing protein [Oscillospiraceae bacterium]
MANFTDEQIAQLSGNQNVQWVSRTGVQFTPEFKLLAWEQKQQGRRMKDIFRDNGIDPDILGRKRIENFSVRLDDAVREGRFLPDRRIYNSRPAGQQPRNRCLLRSVSAGSSMNWSMQSRKSSS